MAGKAAAGTTSEEGKKELQQQNTNESIPFRDLSRRPRMAVLEWLPSRSKVLVNEASWVNGVCVSDSQTEGALKLWGW